MRLDYGRCDGVLFRISLSRRLLLVQTATPQPWGGEVWWGKGDNITCCVAAIQTPDLPGRGRVGSV